MTNALLTPWYHRRRRQSVVPTAQATGGVAETRILDHQARGVRQLTGWVRAQGAGTEADLVRRAHAAIGRRVRAVYAMNDQQPSSETLRRGRGSCSQRMALLESVARGAEIPTRVRGLVLDGRFWYPRFPRLRSIVPDRVLLAWPDFLLDGEWISVTDLYSADSGEQPFTNSGGETLFGAIRRSKIDWDGTCEGPSCDLSRWVIEDLGRFDSRDEFFDTHGQTLCRLARAVADPVMSRWSPGSGAERA